MVQISLQCLLQLLQLLYQCVNCMHWLRVQFKDRTRRSAFLKTHELHQVQSF